MKETDPQAAIEKAQQQEVFKPDGLPYLELEITTRPPEEVAERILDELAKAQ